MTASPSTPAKAAPVNTLTIWTFREGVDTVVSAKSKGSKLSTFHDHSGACKIVQGFEGETLPVAAAMKSYKAELAREQRGEDRTQYFCIRCLIRRVPTVKPAAAPKATKATKAAKVADTNTAADNPEDKAAVATPAPAKKVSAKRTRKPRTVTAKV